MPPRSPPALPDELLEEIFLRLPPDQPACLVRASLASKLWLGVLTGSRLHGLYREHHGAPPMLGFIYSCPKGHLPEQGESHPQFVGTTKFRMRIPTDEDWRAWHRDYTAWDCRHGRVLFCNNGVIPIPLIVWDPMTGSRRLMCAPKDYDSSGAAVLCNVTGCDHRACHAGPFQMVFVGLYNNDGGCVAYAHVSLPDVGKWSDSCPPLDLAMKNTFFLDSTPSIFIQDALYFMLTYEYHDNGGDNHNIAILKYDLGSSCLSLIDGLPVGPCVGGQMVLMALEDASLGFAHVHGITLNLWSRHMGSNGVMTWTRCRVIDLKTLLPIRNPKDNNRLIGSVEGNDIIFAIMDLAIYEINLKSLRCRKIRKRKQCCALFPYMSFYNPPERVSLGDAAPRARPRKSFSFSYSSLKNSHNFVHWISSMVTSCFGSNLFAYKRKKVISEH